MVFYCVMGCFYCKCIGSDGGVRSQRQCDTNNFFYVS